MFGPLGKDKGTSYLISEDSPHFTLPAFILMFYPTRIQHVKMWNRFINLTCTILQ